LLDRDGLGSASGTASLGMLADDALLAVVRYQAGRTLAESDRASLEQALQVLQAIGELGERRVEATSGLRAMASLGALDETVQAITDASKAETAGPLDVLKELQDGIRAVLAGKAEGETTERLRVFFDRLGAVTLARSEEIVRPRREQRVKWITEALGS